MDGNWNLRLRRLCGEDNNILMKSHIAAADEPCARSAGETRRSAASATRHNLVKGGMVLCGKDLSSQFRNVLPSHSVQIFAFLVVPCVPFLPSLVLLDVQFSLLPNARLISTWADNNVLSIDHFRIWVRSAAPKTIWYVSPRRRAFAGLGPAVSLDRLLSHAGMCLALGEVELLTAALLNANYVPDMVQVILRLD
jgi:hypothetical protein